MLFDSVQCVQYFSMCYMQCIYYDNVNKQYDKLLSKLFPYLSVESTTESEQND